MVVKKKQFANVRGDVIENKKLITDIERDTIEARVTLGNLMGFDYDPSEAHDEQTPQKNINDNVTTTVKTR